MSNDLADYATRADTLEAKLPNGETFEFKDFDDETEDAIMAAAENEDDLIRRYLDELIVDERLADVEAKDMPAAKRNEFFMAIQKRVNGLGELEDLMDRMETAGNRR